MSITASTNFITSFDAMVKQAFQGSGKLRERVRVKTGVVGSTHVFPKLGRGLATERIPQTDVTPMNVVHSKATATIQDWNAPEYTDIFDLSKLAFDEKKELSMTIANASGRRLDQLIINALVAGANSTTVGVNVGGTNTGLNIDKILRAKRLMDDAGVPDDGDRTIVCSAYALEQALLDPKVTSGDYNVLRPLMEGSLKDFAGFRFVFIENRNGTGREGGLPIASLVRSNFAFHRSAVGLAVGLDMRTSVDWIAEKTSWLMNGMFSAGSIVIDNEGVYTVSTYEA